MRPISWFFYDCLLSVSSHGRKSKLGLCGVCLFDFNWASLVADNKESACNVRDPSSIPGSGRSPGKGIGNPSSILAWRSPWTEEPGRLQSQRVGIIVRHNWVVNTFTLFYKKSSFSFIKVLFFFLIIEATPSRLSKGPVSQYHHFEIWILGLTNIGAHNFFFKERNMCPHTEEKRVSHFRTNSRM